MKGEFRFSFYVSLGVQILVNLITDCPQEVQSLAAANLANMAKSSLGRNILKRHGGLQKLVRLKFKVAEWGESLISDSFGLGLRLSVDVFRVILFGKRGFLQSVLPQRCTNGIGKLLVIFVKVLGRNEWLTDLLRDITLEFYSNKA